MEIPTLSTKPLYPSYQEQLLEIISGVQAQSNKEFQADVVEIIRPADTTPYSIGDVISDNSLTTLNLGFIGIFRTKSIGLITNNVAWTGKKIRIYLFDKAIGPFTDNVPYGIYYSLADYCMGYADITVSSEVAGDSCYWIANELNLIGEITSQDMYFVLVCKDAVTPTSGQKFKLRIETEVPAYLYS